MNPREKILAGSVAGLIVAFFGYALIKSMVYEPAKSLAADIAREKERQDMLNVRLNGAEMTVRSWQNQARQTLHAEVSAAALAFREDVDMLLRRNNLETDLTVTPGKERTERKGSREGFVDVPLSVRASGKLGDLVNFLKDFYQRPYLVRVDKLTLAAKLASSSKSKRGKTAPKEPKLSVSMTLSTLVLPKVDGIEHTVIDLVALNNPDPEAEPLVVSSARLRQEDPVAYNQIANTNIFEMFRPPPPPPPKPRNLPKRVVERDEPREEPPKRPPVDLRRDAHKFVLGGVGWLDDGPVAYVANADEPTELPIGYRLNDEVDGGKVVLIVPQGMVVRTPPPKTGRREPPKNYFYALGASFNDRKEVNPTDHQEITRVLRLVLKP